MGRGRAKAKEKKVARELKYTSQTIDLERLRKDLHTGDDPARSDQVDGPKESPAEG
jgi:hypothetical protein